MMLTKQGGQEKDDSWDWCSSQLEVKEGDSQLPAHKRYKILHIRDIRHWRWKIGDLTNMLSKIVRSPPSEETWAVTGIEVQ